MAGSVWETTPQLREEFTLGLESAASTPEDVLGTIGGIAFDGSDLFVLDSQQAQILVFDEQGRLTRRLGRSGQGPGEFQQPTLLGLDPGKRLIVQDLARVVVLGLEGTPLTTWPYPGGLVRPIVVTRDGTAFVPRPIRTPTGPVPGLLGISVDGAPVREVTPPPRDIRPWELVAEMPTGGSRRQLVPYAPRSVWNVLPSGAVATAVSAYYSIEITREAAREVIRIQRAVEPVGLPEEERQWQRDSVVADMRRFDPSWQWNAMPVPEHRPLLDAIYGDWHGRLWVARTVRSDRLPPSSCDLPADESVPARPCWRVTHELDAFDVMTGRFLGTLAVPEGAQISPPPAFSENHVAFVMEDPAGQVLVRKFRVVHE